MLFFLIFKNDKQLSNDELLSLSKELFSQAAEEYHDSGTYSHLDPRLEYWQKTFASVLKTVYENRNNLHVQDTDLSEDKFGTAWVLYTDNWSPSYVFQMYISEYRKAWYNKKAWYISDVSVKWAWNNIHALSEVERWEADAVLWKIQNLSETELDSIIHPAIATSAQDILLFKNLILGSRDLAKTEFCPLFYSDNSIDEIKKFIPNYAWDKAFVIECAGDSQKLKITISNDGKIMGYRIF